MVQFSSFCAVFLSVSWWVAQGMLQGQRINAVAYPWLAGLVEGSTWLAKCSGAIIHPHFVLTASSCFLIRGTAIEIQKNDFVVVIPTRVNQVRLIDMLVFPNRSIFDYQTAGLIGVKRAFSMKPGKASILPVWSWDRDILTKQFKYIFDNAGFLTCEVVTWKDEPPIKPDRDPDSGEVKYENSYDVKVVSAADVQLLNPDVCKANLCSNFSYPSGCEVLLNQSMCVKALDPDKAYLCGADQGAALACNDFTWGVLTGEVDCKPGPSGVQYPLVFRVDYAVDFLNEHKTYYPPDTSESSVRLLPKPLILLSAQYMGFLFKFYRFILFLSVNYFYISTSLSFEAEQFLGNKTCMEASKYAQSCCSNHSEDILSFYLGMYLAPVPVYIKA